MTNRRRRLHACPLISRRDQGYAKPSIADHAQRTPSVAKRTDSVRGSAEPAIRIKPPVDVSMLLLRRQDNVESKLAVVLRCCADGGRVQLDHSRVASSTCISIGMPRAPNAG